MSKTKIIPTVFLLFAVMLTGCSDDLEGEITLYSISCVEDKAGNWVPHSDQVSKSQYRVSFAGQYVISSTGGSAKKNCTVYDRNNWNCNDPYPEGWDEHIKDGKYNGPECSGYSRVCFLGVDWSDRTSISRNGNDAVARICTDHSDEFKAELR